jgi:hypothetical protein
MNQLHEYTADVTLYPRRTRMVFPLWASSPEAAHRSAEDAIRAALLPDSKLVQSVSIHVMPAIFTHDELRRLVQDGAAEIAATHQRKG